jgi:8-oxo-dGTP pyrophosphatase MutT (NUDIX family)
MYTIYFATKPLFICTEISKEIEDYSHRPTTILIDELNIHTIKTMIEELQKPDVLAGIFLHNDADAVLEGIKKQFKVLVAAGGFTYTKDDHVLMIFRRNKWDLPKGKLDDEEDLETCALREVQEETGIKKIKLEEKLCITYHTYHENSDFILKDSHWYLMKAKEKEKLEPQTEEDITECKWIHSSELNIYLQNSLPSITDVVYAAANKLNWKINSF